ncbi:acyl carrier protein [Streptomyces sp. NPDC096354]|uniref:acyl carrier protein n=1 Tax=Streptomyces sp. NPDC096354 TaxID=3366088 RepID=UPI00381ED986
MIARTVAEVLAAVTGRSATRCPAADRVLEAGPGVDGLALLEVVDTLQDRVIITVPDEVTARMRTVRDLQDAVGVLVVAAPVDTSTGKDSS